MDLSDCVKAPDCPHFLRFWECVKKSYWKVTPSYGSRKAAFKAWTKYPKLHNEECTDEMCKQVIDMADSYKKNIAVGAFGFLPHISSWLNGEKWAQNEDKSKPVTKKLATDRPPPVPIETVKHKEYTKEEREKMQSGFNEVKKGVRKNV